MIFYFTGNGNSRYVAECLARKTSDETIDISRILKGEGDVPDLSKETRVGVVFPVHSWYAPRPVVNFLSRLSVPASAYRFAVCTCGDNAGCCMERLSKIFPVQGAWSVTMPNTYIPMFDLDTEELALEKLSAANGRIGNIAESVLRGQTVRDVLHGSGAWIKTYVVNPLFVRFVISPSKFSVGCSCNSCRLCAKRCPVGNIEMKDGRPVWGAACIHCMACVHSCPQTAIQYGSATVSRGRYSLGALLKKL